MTYRLTVYGFDSGLNEVLSGVHFDVRTKRVCNPVKKKNDDTCIKALRSCGVFKGVKIINPIVIHYKFYAKDKRRDRTNIASAFDKSFQDALQKAGIMKNDGWNNVINVTFDFATDKFKPRVEVLIEEIETYDFKIFEWSEYEQDTR